MARIECTEKEIEDLLCEDPSLMDKYLGLTLIDRQVRTPVGVIDLLASFICPWGKEHLVVIELKRGVLDPNAFVQLDRYTGWMKGKKAGAVCSLLIGETLDRRLNHSVKSFWQAYPILNDDTTYYTLMEFSLADGIGFQGSSDAQMIIEFPALAVA